MDRVEPETVRNAVDSARAQGTDRDVRQLLSWAYELLGERLMMSTAFGKSGMVILNEIREAAPQVPVYFLDTGFHFQETLDYIDTLKKWNVNVVLKRPKLYGPEFIKAYGEKPYERDPDFCCHKNKVEPFRELIGGPDAPYQGWITGIRRDQSSTRATAEPIELLEGNQVKIQPLAYWTRQEVEDYIAKHDIPLHPLFSQGYASVGCAPCTARSGDSTDERAGRWAGKAKTECGLHTFWKKTDKAGFQPKPQEKDSSKPSSPAQAAG